MDFTFFSHRFYRNIGSLRLRTFVVAQERDPLYMEAPPQNRMKIGCNWNGTGWTQWGARIDPIAKVVIKSFTSLIVFSGNLYF